MIKKDSDPKGSDEAPSYDCPVCYLLITRPTLTSCQHLFCYPCLMKVMEDKKMCPMCRHSLRKDKPKIDLKIQKAIQSKYPTEFDQREREYKEALERMIKKTILYGNTNEETTRSVDFRPGWFWHKCKVFVEIEDEPAEKYIEKVVFELHPSFRNRTAEKKEAPFVFGCTVWGTFDIPIKIYWKSWLQLPPTDLDYYISFDGEGETRKQTFEFDKNLMEIEEP